MQLSASASATNGRSESSWRGGNLNSFRRAHTWANQRNGAHGGKLQHQRSCFPR